MTASSSGSGGGFVSSYNISHGYQEAPKAPVSASNSPTGYNATHGYTSSPVKTTVPGAPSKTVVVNSPAPAIKDFQNKQTTYNNLKSDITNHKLTVSDKQLNSVNNPSLVDYLNSTSKGSSFSDRAKLAGGYGISNYTGTAEQNTSMLNSLRNKDAAAAANPDGAAINEMNNIISSDGTDTPAPADPLQGKQDAADTAYNDALDKLNTSTDTALTSFNKQIEQLNSGTFPLSTGEQAQISSLNSQFDMLRTEQMKANANYTAGMTQAQAALGNSMYSPQIALGNVASAVNSGIQKLADLSTKQSIAMTKLETSFQTNDYKNVTSAYDSLTKSFTARANEIEKMHTAVTNEVQKLRDFNLKAAKQDIMTKLNSDKLTLAQKKEAYDEVLKTGQLDEKTKNDAGKLLLAQQKAAKSGGGKPITFTNSQKEKLMNGTGLSPDDLSAFEKDVNSHGLDAALGGISDQSVVQKIRDTITPPKKSATPTFNASQVPGN